MKYINYLKILILDSKTIHDPQNTAYDCIPHLNELIPKYNLIISTPVIETGVSIDVKNHINCVEIIANGTQEIEGVCQSIGRVRDTNKDILFWIAKRAIALPYGGETSPSDIASSMKRTKDFSEKMTNFYVITDNGIKGDFIINHYCNMIAKNNYYKSFYRDFIIGRLERKGFIIEDDFINPESKEKVKIIKQELTENRDIQYLKECEKIANAPDINDMEYASMEKTQIRTKSDTRKMTKHQIIVILIKIGTNAMKNCSCRLGRAIAIPNI